MTVSPNRPQDGKLPPVVGGNGVEPNDRSSLANLPPTLFRLPNLAMQQAAASDGAAFGAADRDLHESLQFDPEAGSLDQRLASESEESEVSPAGRETGSSQVPVSFSSSRQTDSHFGDSLVAAAADASTEILRKAVPEFDSGLNGQPGRLRSLSPLHRVLAAHTSHDSSADWSMPFVIVLDVPLKIEAERSPSVGVLVGKHRDQLPKHVGNDVLTPVSECGHHTMSCIRFNDCK